MGPFDILPLWSDLYFDHIIANFLCNRFTDIENKEDNIWFIHSEFYENVIKSNLPTFALPKPIYEWDNFPTIIPS